MRKKLYILILLFLISSAFHIRIININLNPYDEAVMLVGAERILNGEVPYKDFFSQYTPGQYYALAWVFKIFGVSVLAERIYDIIVKSLLSLSIFLIISLVSSYKYALLGWTMSLIWGGYINFPAYPVYPAILFINIGIYLILLYFKHNRIFYIHLSALSIMFASLFRHDMGGMAFFIIIAPFLFFIERPKRAAFKNFIATVIFSSLLVVFYFFIRSDIRAVIDALLIFPLSDFQKFQGIPYPRHLSFNTLPFFVFPFLLFVGLLTALFLLKVKRDNLTTYGTLLISLVGITFITQAVGRSDIVHILPLGLMSTSLAPILLFILSGALSLNANKNALLFLLFIGFFFCVVMYKPIKLRIKSFPDKYIIKIINSDIPRAQYIELRDRDIKNVIAFIKQHTSKDEFIYSGLKDHDALVFNNALIYFLSERKSATRYHEMNPGFTTLPEIQKEIVSELKEKAVNLAVLVPGLWNAPRINNYKQDFDVLDNYIANNFKLSKTFGKYEIWMKKDQDRRI
jgi:hypothetical protein